MHPFERGAKLLYARVGASILSMLVFVGIGVHAHFIANVPLGLSAIIPLGIAVIILPRHTRRGSLAGLATSEDPAYAELRLRVARLGSFTTTLRMVYLAVALVVFFILPVFVPDAT